MSTQSRYGIKPDTIWSIESKGRILVIDLHNEVNIWLSGYDAIMWRSIWQGISPLTWKTQVEESGFDPMEILNEWINTGLISEVQS